MKTTKPTPTKPCPVCGAKTKTDSFHKASGICLRCFHFLHPTDERVMEQKDMGNFMYQVRNDRGSFSTTSIRSLNVRPRGFWSDTIQVNEREKFSGLTKGFQPITVDLSWSCGGMDDSLDAVEAAKNFRDALSFAIEKAGQWQADRRAEQENLYQALAKHLKKEE